MKRFLLSIAICMVAVTVVAQNPTKVSKVPATNHQASAKVTSITGNEAVPTNYVPQQMRNPVWGAIGETYYDTERKITIIFNKPFHYNRQVDKTRFLATHTKDFSLGPMETREVLLFNKR